MTHRERKQIVGQNKEDAWALSNSFLIRSNTFHGTDFQQKLSSLKDKKFILVAFLPGLTETKLLLIQINFKQIFCIL